MYGIAKQSIEIGWAFGRSESLPIQCMTTGIENFNSDMKRLIRVLYNFTAENSYEVSCEVGEIFQVVDDSDMDWYEVVGINDDAKYGMVPKSYCADVNKNEVAEEQEQVQEEHEEHEKEDVFAIVLFDFIPENKDEVAAKEGDRVCILAQTSGWYLAKHTTRNLEPGLIPASYAELDNSTGLRIPSVEEWRSQRNDAKTERELSKGVGDLNISTTPSKAVRSFNQSHHSERTSAHSILAAEVPSYQHVNGRFIFVLNVIRMHSFEHVLFRTHKDLLNLQKKLLITFPVEAGRTGMKRILPYLPTPVKEMTTTLAERFRAEFSVYLRELLALPKSISKSSIVLQFFLPRQGDGSAKGLRSEHSIDGGAHLAKLSQGTRERMKHTRLSKPENPVTIDTSASLRSHRAIRSMSPTMKKLDSHFMRKNSGPLQLPKITIPELNEDLSIRSGNEVDTPFSSLAGVDSAPILEPIFSPVSPVARKDEWADSWSRKNSIPELDEPGTPSTAGRSVGSGYSSRSSGGRYITVKVVEPENVSFFKVRKTVRFEQFRTKLVEALGVMIRSILVESSRDGTLQPLSNDLDLHLAIEGSRDSLIVVHI